MEAMTNAAAEGARQADAKVTIKRSAEIVPGDTAGTAHYKCDREAAVATPEELGDYDAIIFGISIRYDSMVAQMKNLPDQSGSL